MTLEDLDQTLPNGLHDARIRSFSHDFESAVVKLEVEVLFGLPEDPPSERSCYRNAEILFHQVLFCSVEIPENERIIGHPGSIWFVFERIGLESLPEKIAKVLPLEVLCYSLYILEWNRKSALRLTL